MTRATISDKGQITLPAQARKKLGLIPRSKVEIEVRDNEIIIRPAASISELYGSLNEYAKDKTENWETMRRVTEKTIAEEVANEDK